MKKTMLVILMLVSITLVGCEQKTLTLNDLEYVRIVETEKGDLAIFKRSDGAEKILYLDTNGKNVVFSMETGKVYNVTFTAETITKYGDFLLTAELVNE